METEEEASADGIEPTTDERQNLEAESEERDAEVYFIETDVEPKDEFQRRIELSTLQELSTPKKYARLRRGLIQDVR